MSLLGAAEQQTGYATSSTEEEESNNLLTMQPKVVMAANGAVFGRVPVYRLKVCRWPLLALGMVALALAAFTYNTMEAKDKTVRRSCGNYLYLKDCSDDKKCTFDWDTYQCIAKRVRPPSAPTMPKARTTPDENGRAAPPAPKENRNMAMAEAASCLKEKHTKRLKLGRDYKTQAAYIEDCDLCCKYHPFTLGVMTCDDMCKKTADTKYPNNVGGGSGNVKLTPLEQRQAKFAADKKKASKARAQKAANHANNAAMASHGYNNGGRRLRSLA